MVNKSIQKCSREDFSFKSNFPFRSFFRFEKGLNLMSNSNWTALKLSGIVFVNQTKKHFRRSICHLRQRGQLGDEEIQPERSREREKKEKESS